MGSIPIASANPLQDARLHALGIEAMRLGDEIAVTWQPGPRLAELTRRFDAVMAERAAIRAGLGS